MSEIAKLLSALNGYGLKQADIVRRTSVPQPRVSRWSRASEHRVADDALKIRALLDEVAKERRKEARKKAA